jgi:RNA recognition motif-containing protein
MSKLFVGNLSWNTSEEDLAEHFGSCGTVKSAKIIVDKSTDKSKGFGFVEMENMEQANAAISKLNDQPLQDRNIRVSLAQERQDRPAGGGGYSGGGGGGYSDRPRREPRSDYGNGGGRSSYGNRDR